MTNTYLGSPTIRRERCKECKARWKTRELLIAKSVATGITKPSATNSSSVATNSNTNSNGGVRGGLPSGVVSLSVVESDHKSKSVVLSNPDQTRARPKKQAKEPGPFKRMLADFIAEWEERYEDQYPVEAKDCAALSKMLKATPQYEKRWFEMLGRYFSNTFWASKRHPLHGLCTQAREFAGPAGSAVPQKVQDGRDTAKEWMSR